MERVRVLTPSDRDAVRALWELRFDDSPSFRDWFFAHRYSPETSVCLTIDGRIASVAQGYPMRVRLRGITLPALMISGVSTHPDFEKRGLMHRVMTAMMQLCRDFEIPCAFHTPARLPTFFSLGHLPCTDTLRYRSDAAGASPARWDDVPQLSELTRVYGEASRRYSGVVERDEAAMAQKRDDYLSDGARCVTFRREGRLCGYLFGFDTEDGFYAEEVMALDTPAYEALLSRLPCGAQAKLPPDLPFAGEITPQGVMGAANVPALLNALCGDESLVFDVTDPVVPQNNGTFDGGGKLTDRHANHVVAAGTLMQHLCGYVPLDGAFDRQTCFVVDEY